MTSRMDIGNLAPKQYKAMIHLDNSLADVSLPKPLLELVKLRASQINGCVYCVDMHTTDAKTGGETDQRLHRLVVWREAPDFTETERAAFALTEAMTRIHADAVPDDVWDLARKHFSDTELAELIMVIVTINSWNRICATTRMEPGS